MRTNNPPPCREKVFTIPSPIFVAFLVPYNIPRLGIVLSIATAEMFFYRLPVGHSKQELRDHTKDLRLTYAITSNYAKKLRNLYTGYGRGGDAAQMEHSPCLALRKSGGYDNHALL